MADLNDLQAAQTIKIAGANSSGTETNFVNASGSGALLVDGSAVVQPVSATSLPLPSGASTSALQVTGNSSLSSIDTKINALTTNPTYSSSGIVVRPISLEFPTFALVATSIVIGSNKSMLAIQNTGSSVVRIREIWIINDQTTAVVGIAGTFEIRRITSFSGGSSVTPASYDTDDTLPSGISAATGATVSGESTLLRQGVWSTDDWGPGTLDTESLDHAIQNTAPFFSQPPNGKALTIRQNQGIHIKFASLSVAGAFNLRIIFTTE